MKIDRLLLENVTSYADSTEFRFNERLNIFIGPNGGGKSNLQKIIAVALTHYFIHQWQIRQDEDRSLFERAQTYKKTQLRNLLATFGGNDRPQVIELELRPEAHDIENIKVIGNNLDSINRQLAYFEQPYSEYEPFQLLNEIESSKSFTYRIIDRELQVPAKGTAAYGFLRYLNDFFIFMRVTKDIPEVVLSAPIFFFTSERALTKGFEIQAGHLTEDSYMSGFQTAFNAATGQTNLLQWGSQHFVRLYRRALSAAGRSRVAHFEDFLRQEPDVKLLDRYLEKLGYGWTLDHDEEQTKFRLGLTRGGLKFYSEVFSSGEREIIHFLVAMFALNVRDGLILVDEPELHLHPRWQRIFLNLFRDLAPERNNQFLIATHSPVFVSPETIQSVVRIYRPEGGSSKKVSLEEIEDLPERRQLIRMINSQNNERMFFADKVVLVEGISDRIVIGSLVAQAAERFKDNRSIEIVDVGGKENFKGYTRLLDAIETPWAIVADRDYLEQVGDESVRAFFQSDTGSQYKALAKDKKSLDRGNLVAALKQYVENDEKEHVLELLQYIEQRHRRLRSDLTEDEHQQLNSEFDRLSSQGLELLKYGGGEIEDYLPERLSDLGSIVELVNDKQWITNISDKKRRVHLGQIAGRILDLSAEDKDKLIRTLRRAEPLISD